MVSRMWQVRARQSVAAILAVVAVLLTAFPPPSLPLRLLPAVSALVLAAMFIWSQGHSAPIPPEHAEALRELAVRLISFLDLSRKVSFSDDPDEDRVWRDAFESHFRTRYQALTTWDDLVSQSENAEVNLAIRINKETGVLAKTYKLNDEHVRAGLKKAAATANNPTAGNPLNLTIMPSPDGWVLLLGGSVIGQYDAANGAQSANDAFVRLAADIPNWQEQSSAEEARSKLANHKALLRAQLTEISKSHGIGGSCKLCASR